VASGCTAAAGHHRSWPAQPTGSLATHSNDRQTDRRTDITTGLNIVFFAFTGDERKKIKTALEQKSHSSDKLVPSASSEYQSYMGSTNPTA